MPVTFVPGGRYENAAGAFTVLEVDDGHLRVLTDAGHIGRYTIANQQIHARPTRKPSPLAARVVDPRLENIAAIVGRVLMARGWELYTQPHLNGLRPDLVLLNPRVGIALYHVSELDAHSLSTDCAHALVKIMGAYKQEVLGLYCPRLGLKVSEVPDALAVVTTGLILPNLSTAEAKALVMPALEKAHLLGAAERYMPICGSDVLEKADVDVLLPSAAFNTSRHMAQEFAEDLRAWLYEPDHMATSRVGLELDDQQKRLARSRTRTGYRRLKGPAGSGKSLVLAARAAELALQGKAVLVVSFNITLLYYLRSLATRYPAPGVGLTNRVTWIHFHDWCKRICLMTGFEDEYGALWRGQDDNEDPGPVLETNLPALVGRALTAAPGRVPTYDAVLVDEGQDFNLDWWNLLKRVLRADAEMLLVADETQDLYERARAWTDQAMLGAGFRGEWVRLQASYRLPTALVALLRAFAETFLANGPVNLPQAIQLQLDLEPVRLRWVQVEPSAVVDACIQAVKDSPITADPRPLTYSDVTLLVDTHDLGRMCVEGLERIGIHTAHIFAKDSRNQRRQKLAFQMSEAKVKACTVHSFKGWETRSLIVAITRAGSARDRALVYVALSRLKRHPQGSFLTVVCAAPELEAYGHTWPEFVGHGDG